MRLGNKQRQLLAALGSPSMVLLIGDSVSASLARRGLVREDELRGSCCITPAGMRALADELESGRITDGLERTKRQREKRAAKTS